MNALERIKNFLQKYNSSAIIDEPIRQAIDKLNNNKDPECYYHKIARNLLQGTPYFLLRNGRVYAMYRYGCFGTDIDFQAHIKDVFVHYLNGNDDEYPMVKLEYEPGGVIGSEGLRGQTGIDYAEKKGWRKKRSMK